jgi:hypothetical protein
VEELVQPKSSTAASKQHADFHPKLKSPWALSHVNNGVPVHQRMDVKVKVLHLQVYLGIPISSTAESLIPHIFPMFHQAVSSCAQLLVQRG